MGDAKNKPALIHEPALEEQLVHWLTTPKEHREHTSMKALAQSMGIAPQTLVKFMSARPEIGYRVLKSLSTYATDSISPMLAMLHTEAVEKHNVRAAEVALEFLRKTLSDDGRYVTAGPKVQVNQLVTNTADAAQALLDAAQALGATAPGKSTGRRATGAVETTFEVTPPQGWPSPRNAEPGGTPTDPSDADG